MKSAAEVMGSSIPEIRTPDARLYQESPGEAASTVHARRTCGDADRERVLDQESGSGGIRSRKFSGHVSIRCTPWAGGPAGG
jgi:hypothetical protein